MKLITTLAFAATLLVSSVVSADEPMKNLACVQLSSGQHVKLQQSGDQTISPGHSSFITPVLFRKGITSVAVLGQGYMGCFIVRIAPTAYDNFGTGGETVAGMFSKDTCLFLVDAKKSDVYAIMVENDDKVPHNYDVMTIADVDTCQ